METLTDMIAGFLAGLTPGTRAQYRSVVSRWLRWCSDNPAVYDVSPMCIGVSVNESGLYGLSRYSMYSL